MYENFCLQHIPNTDYYFSWIEIAAIIFTAKECCVESNVPEYCRGLCAPNEMISRSGIGKSLNACSKYGSVIDRCFQPVVQGNLAI